MTLKFFPGYGIFLNPSRNQAVAASQDYKQLSRYSFTRECSQFLKWVEKTFDTWRKLSYSWSVLRFSYIHSNLEGINTWEFLIDKLRNGSVLPHPIRTFRAKHSSSIPHEKWQKFWCSICMRHLALAPKLPANTWPCNMCPTPARQPANTTLHNKCSLEVVCSSNLVLEGVVCKRASWEINMNNFSMQFPRRKL